MCSGNEEDKFFETHECKMIPIRYYLRQLLEEWDSEDERGDVDDIVARLNALVNDLNRSSWNLLTKLKTSM